MPHVSAACARFVSPSRDPSVAGCEPGAQGLAALLEAIDGNIHAAELTASTTCLYYVHHLLSMHGGSSAEAQQINRLLDTRTLYIVPRLNPDGAELALADGWKSITKRKAALPDADEWKDKPNKIAELVR